MYFKINGPFGLNICFALELAWEAFQTGAPQTCFPFCFCAVPSRLSPGLFTRKMRSPDKSLTDVWLQHGREQGCRDVTTLHQVPQKLNSWRWNSALFTTKNSSRSLCSVSRQKVYHSCKISVVLLKIGILLELGVDDSPWASLLAVGMGDVCPHHVPSLSASQPFPSLST